MRPVAINQVSSQLTLNFESSLPDRFPTLRQYIAHRAAIQAKPLKVIASDMDISPSTLTRKLNPADGDTQRFNVDDMEEYLKSTGDATAVIEYLIAKYMDTDEQRRARTLSKLEALLPDLVSAIGSLKEPA